MVDDMEQRMDLFKKLRAVALQQNLSGEFPSWLMDEILAIADKPEQYKDRERFVEKLISQIGDYDPYAGAGCFDTSVGVDTIRSTLRRVNVNKESGQCELMSCCQFFADNFRDMPKAAAYIKEKLCLADCRSCNRFKIYEEFGKENLPLDLDPFDTEEVRKIILCLRNKKRSNE